MNKGGESLGSPHQARQLSSTGGQSVPATGQHFKKNWPTPARGNVTGKHVSPKIAIGFDQSMFDRIAGEAARRRMPFGAVVREKLLAFYSTEGK